MKFQFTSKTPSHNIFLCRLAYHIIPVRNSGSVAAVISRDMGSYPPQDDCNDTLNMFGSSQHRFMKGKSCLNSLSAFHNEMTVLVVEGRAADVVYLEFGKAFSIVSHNILHREADKVLVGLVESKVD